MASPTRRVPRWTKTVATGPLPTSNWASITTSRRRSLGVGLELLHLGHKKDHIHEFVQIQALFRGHLHHDGLATPGLGDQPLVRQLLLDQIGVGIGKVHLVDGHHDGHLGRLGVADGLQRLGHDPVVGRDHDHGDIGGLRSPGAHGREGFVARSVEEGDLPLVVRHLIGTDVLGDATGLRLDHFGLADGVQK